MISEAQLHATKSQEERNAMVSGNQTVWFKFISFDYGVSEIDKKKPVDNDKEKK